MPDYIPPVYYSYLYYQAAIDMYLYLCDLTVSRYGGYSVYNTDMATRPSRLASSAPPPNHLVPVVSGEKALNIKKYK